MVENRPTYEELQSRVAELGAGAQDAKRRLERLIALKDPRDKIMLGIWEQIRASGLADRQIGRAHV